jgi:diguanylate cyclase (GGDEF)-like protein
VRANAGKTTEVVVAERLLVGLLGPPVTVTRISTNGQISRVDRGWSCGCQASMDMFGARLACWVACRRHEAIFFVADDTEVGESSDRVRAFLAGSQVKFWGVPALGLGIAIVGKALYEARVLLKRAEEAESASLVDPLTGLYNRRGWDRRIEEERKRLKRDSKPVIAIYMLDVDGLKATNDERGHSAGDAILRHVSKVIREVTREHDVAARLGGDEFAILTLQSQAAEADLIRARLERGFHSASLSVSIGFAFANSGDAINEAMDRADIAMYEVKKNNAAHAARNH